MACAYLVKNLLKGIKLLKRRLAHDPEYLLAGVLGRHLQAPRNMPANQLFGIGAIGPGGSLVSRAVEQQVVAHAAANETLLDPGQGINGMVKIEQTRMTRIQIRTHLRMNA